MQSHFGFTDEQMNSLKEQGVTIRHLFEWANKYKIGSSSAEVSYINLFYYVDEKGDFEGKPDFPSRIISRTIFENLTIHQKIELSEYIESKIDGEF